MLNFPDSHLPGIDADDFSHAREIGELIKLVGTSGELNSQHQDYPSEENGAIALVHALDVSDEPVYIYDTQGKCQWVNRSGESLLHLDTRQIIGRYIFELFPGQSRFQIKAWRRVIDAKEPSSFISETTINGEVHKFQTSIFPVMDYGGRVQSVVSIGRLFADRDILQYENQMQGAELDLIHEIASIVTSSLEIGDVYERFAAEFKKLVDFDRIVVMELDETGEYVIPTFASTARPSSSCKKEPIPLYNTGMAWVITHQRTLIENDLRLHRMFESDDDLLEMGIRSIVRVPLITRSGIIGVMTLGSYHPNTFGDREQAVAEQMAAQIAPAIENARLYQASQEYAKELEVLDGIASVITSSLRIEEVYERFASGVRNLVDFDRISIIVVDAEGNTAWQEYVSESERFDLDYSQPRRIENTPTGWVISSGVTLVEPDLAESIQYESDRAFLEKGIRSIIRVPFVSKERAIGAFALNSKQSRAFGPRERRLLERLAAQIAPAIENARLYEEAQDRAQELQVIDDIATMLTSSLHIEDVYERFAAEVKKLVDFDRMAVILVDDESEKAKIAHVSGLDRKGLKAIASRPLKNSHIEWVVEHRDTLIADDISRSGALRFPEDRTLLEAGLISGIRTPLLIKNKVLGTYTLWSARPSAYGPREKRIVERLSAQIAPAIENARLYEEVERALNTLKTTQEQLVRVERLRAMGELASGVAHDLNNALAAILGRVQILINQVKESPHQRSLQLIEQAAQDSAQVVRRILDFARLESHTEFSNVDVNRLIEDIVELTRHKWHDEAQSKGQVIEIKTNIGDVPIVLGNYSELREALMNLVINAYEAIPEDGAIELRTYHSENYVHIDISDSGSGMTPEVQQRIFDPFFTTKGSSGTGIGMSVTLGIITRHNGSIDVDSEAGKGTTIHISMPIAELTENALSEEAPASPETSKTARILVVEDELLIRETLYDMLDLGNHKITLACNGEEGIRLFNEGDFDIVFTDLGMPGISGWEVARTIRECSKDIPIIMVTGWGVGIDRAEMEENGVNEVLPKPFDIDLVLNLVQRLMEGDEGEE
jgi:signal transduction histidine kinase/ActR/RegA family two-component response regulator/putative methionine-R-sulfoxide reductase with GAF domain